MKMKLIIGIAITHLVTKKKQSIVAMLGVVFGISMFIVMIGFMTGVNQFMEDAAMDGSPHVRIYNPLLINEEKIIAAEKSGATDWVVVQHQLPENELPKVKNALQLVDEIEAMPEVEGVAPQLSTQAFFNNGPIKISGSVSGIDVEKQKELFDLQEKMTEGDLDELTTTNNSLILGRGLAKKLNAKVGNKVSITTPEGINLLLRVVGIFSYGIGAQDEAKSFASLKTVQKILQKDPSYITDLNIKMRDYLHARPFAEKLSGQLHVFAEDWETANSSLLAGDKIRNAMTGIISLTLLLVAGFGIYNIMNMNIMNKMKDIAILKATGFQSDDIVGIFLLQSVIIGTVGGLLGISIGYGCCRLLDMVPFPAGEFLRVDTLPVNFDPKYYVAGVFFGLITTLFAGYFPAKKAAKIDPVQIIRG
jgi:lipoprotein-releasing system permease protein